MSCNIGFLSLGSQLSANNLSERQTGVMFRHVDITTYRTLDEPCLTYAWSASKSDYGARARA